MYAPSYRRAFDHLPPLGVRTICGGLRLILPGAPARCQQTAWELPGQTTFRAACLADPWVKLMLAKLPCRRSENSRVWDPSPQPQVTRKRKEITMEKSERDQRLVQGSNCAIASWTSAFMLAAIMIPQPASAQTFTVLHHFTNLGEGENPGAGLTMDHAGTLYGTTYHGGQHSLGTVFRLNAHGGTLDVLYSFRGGMDGGGPFSRVVFGPSGILYGTTWLGGNGCAGSGCGTVYRLRPFSLHLSLSALSLDGERDLPL